MSTMIGAMYGVERHAKQLTNEERLAFTVSTIYFTQTHNKLFLHPVRHVPLTLNDYFVKYY